MCIRDSINTIKSTPSSSSSLSLVTANVAAPVTTFDKQIQKWIECDNKLKKINGDVKILRDIKNELETSIMTTVNNRKLLNTHIPTQDGKIRFVESKITNPISLTFIEKCLHEIIPNKSQAHQILQYIKQKREIKTNAEIKRYYSN